MASLDDKPKCFGKLDKVFPMTGSGLRQSPDHCLLECPHKTPCLRKALQQDPESPPMLEEKVDEAYDSGLVTFFERWSKKKYLKKRQKGKS